MRHYQSSWSLRHGPEAVPGRLQTVQVRPCLNDLHDGNDGSDVPVHRCIPQSQLQGVQPGVLQVTKVGYRCNSLVPDPMTDCPKTPSP
jgi:hypothetical protein